MRAIENVPEILLLATGLLLMLLLAWLTVHILVIGEKDQRKKRIGITTIATSLSFLILITVLLNNVSASDPKIRDSDTPLLNLMDRHPHKSCASFGFGAFMGGVIATGKVAGSIPNPHASFAALVIGSGISAVSMHTTYERCLDIRKKRAEEREKANRKLWFWQRK